jgi:iron complex transport system substrate-binding protein
MLKVKTAFQQTQRVPHSQLIDLCGGKNVAICAMTSGTGMTEVTMESVLMWKPDLIITTDSNFTDQVYKDKNWRLIPAVKKKDISCSKQPL